MLGDFDEASGDETAGGGAGGPHERLPELARRLGGSCGVLGGGDGAGGFGGADGLVPAATAEQIEDGLFELLVLCGRLMGAAGVGAEADVVPVALPLFAPGNRAATGGAGLWGVLGGELGWSLFAVGHGLESFPYTYLRL